MIVTPETLRNSRKSYTVILQGIIREFNKNKDVFFFLLEGKDATYYRPRIGAVLADIGGTFSFKNCDGKKNVKDLAVAIRSNLSLTKLHYILFMDRDYEHDIIEISTGDAFVTDGYSVENYYTTLGAASASVRSLFFSDAVHTEEDERCVDRILELYAEVQGEVHREIALFNYWAWAQRHSERSGNLNLDVFSLKDFVDIDFALAKASSSYDLEKLNSLAPNRLPVTPDEIVMAGTWFSSRRPQAHFRGKQEAELMIAFLQWLSERAQIAADPFSSKKKCSARLSKKEMLLDLSPYADTPKQLATCIAKRRSDWLALIAA